MELTSKFYQNAFLCYAGGFAASAIAVGFESDNFFGISNSSAQLIQVAIASFLTMGSLYHRGKVQQEKDQELIDSIGRDRRDKINQLHP